MGFGIRLTPTLPGGRKTAIVLQFLTCLAYVIYMTIAGPFLIFHRLEQAVNLRSFLAANLTQKYFLIAHMSSFFCDIHDRIALFNILRQNETIFDIGNG